MVAAVPAPGAWSDDSLPGSVPSTVGIDSAQSNPIFADAEDPLPVARRERRTGYPAFGVSFGIAQYFSGFEGVQQAFHQAEQFYRDQGYAVPFAGEVVMGPVLLPTVLVQLTPSLDVALQVGRATGHDEMKLVGGVVSAAYPFPGRERVLLRAGLGGGVYRFSFRRSYSVRVTPPTETYYYTLDWIRFEAGGNYWTALGGLAYRLGPREALEATVQYVGTGDVSAVTPLAGRVSVNASGTMVGLSLKLLF